MKVGDFWFQASKDSFLKIPLKQLEEKKKEKINPKPNRNADRSLIT